MNSARSVRRLPTHNSRLVRILASEGMANPDHVTADFQQVVGQTMGTAMGAALGVGVVLFFVAARNDRKTIENKMRR
ncbi:hypothetical protein BQ8794_70549 [Mesorhizobium prunaredense]|uniref:Uncharacterized protein n=2 Tax=Mesorhizobium prunaredense TaxID=1631249 RepID=A0A1R3VI63_9HYPH|nr:hypothetical protein BQ8794_70549 [Mesorhizobium prunaredense]